MKGKFLIGALSLLLSISAFAEVRKTDTLKPIEQEFAASDENTLILVDIGQTLLMHKDAVFNTKHENWKRTWLQKNKLGRSEIINALRVVEGETKNWELVDTSWPSLLSSAQKNGAKVAVFTKTYIDSSLKGFHANNLKKMGLPIQDTLKGLPSGKSYEYDAGVIETEETFKGPVLAEVLANMPNPPKKIIFIDDRIEQVESVEKMCKEKGIECLAFQYTASQKAVPSLNELVADFQLKTLMKEHRWISEEEAKAALSKS